MTLYNGTEAFGGCLNLQEPNQYYLFIWIARQLKQDSLDPVKCLLAVLYQLDLNRALIMITWLWRRIQRVYAFHRFLIATQIASFHGQHNNWSMWLSLNTAGFQLESDSFTPSKRQVRNCSFIPFQGRQTRRLADFEHTPNFPSATNFFFLYIKIKIKNVESHAMPRH